VSQSLFPRELYFALRRYIGSEAYVDVLVPWVTTRGGWIQDLLAPLRTYGGWWREEYVFGDLLEQAYVLSRVNDVLLLGSQPPLPESAGLPFAHHLHLDEEWPHINAEQYLSFFARLDMTVIRTTVFDPFLHEIVAVEQSDAPDDPIEIMEIVWPSLMWGDMLFSRSGVRVRAGTNHAVTGIADQSTLHEVFLRRYRHTSDMSLGWGHNSQWKTDFRRDYLTSDAYHLNIDGTDNVDEPGDQSGLTLDQRNELLRHRCVVRVLPRVDGEPYAGNYSLSVPRNAS
jgi:hypothetical protein